MKRDRILILLIIVIVAVALTVFMSKRDAGTTQDAVAPGEGSISLVVIGIEGLEPELIERFAATGELPYLTALMDEGAVGRFASMERGIEMEIPWTSLVTGMRPENQGIGGTRISQRGEVVPAPLTPKHRTVDTIWTLLSNAGRAVGVVGWPGAWPVEEVDGVMAGPHSRVILDQFHNGDISGRILPESQQVALDRMYQDPSTVRRLDLGRFIDLDTRNPYEALIGQNYITLANSYAGDASHVSIARRIAADPGVETLMVHLLGLDGVSQRFWHYMEPERVLSGATLTDKAREEMLVQAETLGVVIERYYQYLDEAIGEILELAADDATVAVVTEHGYKGVELDWVGNPRLGNDMHSDRGVWIMKGPAIRHGARVDDSELIDFAPTLMDAAGITPAIKLDGRVLDEVLR